MKTLQVLAKVCIFYFVLLEVVSSEGRKFKTRDKREYIIDIEEKYSWFDAFRKCKGSRSILAEIDSQAKNDAIIELLKSKKYNYNLWLGGHDSFHSVEGHTRPFFWSANGTKIEFSYWMNANDAHCVHISRGNNEYRWDVADCLNKMGFICEVKKSAV